MKKKHISLFRSKFVSLHYILIKWVNQKRKIMLEIEEELDSLLTQILNDRKTFEREKK